MEKIMSQKIKHCPAGNRYCVFFYTGIFGRKKCAISGRLIKTIDSCRDETNGTYNIQEKKDVSRVN